MASVRKFAYFGTEVRILFTHQHLRPVFNVYGSWPSLSLRLVDFVYLVMLHICGARKIIEVRCAFSGMSVKDLASTMNRPLDNIYEIMLYVDGADAYDTANAQITDMKIIENIVKRAGFRPTRIKSPASQVSEMLQEVSRQKDLELKPR